MRIKPWLKFLLMIIFVVAAVYSESQRQTKKVNIYIPETLYYKNGILGLNVINSSESEKTLTIIMLNENKESIISPIILESGEFVGNISTLNELPIGSKMYTVILKINTKYQLADEKRKVLIIHEE